MDLIIIWHVTLLVFDWCWPLWLIEIDSCLVVLGVMVSLRIKRNMGGVSIVNNKESIFYLRDGENIN